MTVFDSVAREYDDWYKTRKGAFVDEVEARLAFSLINIQPGAKVLDIGCGTGNHTARFIERGCKVTGVDLSLSMLEIAKEKFPSNTFVHSSVYALPFPEDYFDVVFSMLTFEFLEEMEAAYFEMKRVAKPNGQIFIGTINRKSPWGELYQSEKLKGNMVFKEASFKSYEELKSLDSTNISKCDSCLYFPPDTDESNLNWDYESEKSKTEAPGFIAAIWEKKD